MISKPKRDRNAPLKRIYTLDIETDSKGEVIDIGFYDGADVRYFSNWEQFTHHLSSIDEPSIIYAHNGGGFDYVNYMVWLFRNGIKCSAMLKQSSIFCFWLSSAPHIRFFDTFCLLPMSLDKLTKSFAEIEKLEIDTKHYADMRRFKKQNRAKYYDYLSRDCISLYQAVITMRDLVNEVYNIGNLPMSIGGISMRLFRKNFLAPYQIFTPKASTEKEFAFRGYVGGRVEYLGFAPKDKNGWYNSVNGYDFNSHYPAQMIAQEYPVQRGIKTTRLQRDKNGDVATGLYEIEYEQRHGRIPILQDEKSKEYAFSGAGVYTHDEINAILRNNGKIKVKCGYHYEHTAPVFDNFVNFFFSERRKAQELSDGARDLLYKLILNNLYGKYGQRDTVDSLELFSELEAYETRHRLFDKDKRTMVNEKYRIDDEFAYYEVQDVKPCYTSFPSIAAMITARGRMKLCDILESCANPIYCDTDSIHCQDALPKSLIGDELGKLKVEFLDKDAWYGAKKLYEIRDTKRASKGIPPTALLPELWEKLQSQGEAVIPYSAPMKLKTALRSLENSPSEFRKLTRALTVEKSFYEKSLAMRKEV
jgi:hypothetical protein